MAKLLIFVLLAVLCGALHVAADKKLKEAKPKVEEVKKDQKPLPAKADKIDLGPQKDPFFEQILGGIATLAANLIGGTASFLHGAIMVVTNTGHALIKGVGKVADTLVLGAIGLATGVGKGNPAGLKGDVAKGWKHPVMLKEIGYCHTVTRDMCNKMSQNERGKNAPTVTKKSSHLAPKGCYVKKRTKNGKPYQYFVWNKPEYETEKECSEKNMCVCEVCARMTENGKCCTLPFAFEGNLHNDCIGRGGIFGIGQTYKCGVTDIVKDGKDLQTCISQSHQKKIDAANLENPVVDCNGAMTTTGKCCKFPFTLDGSVHNGCTRTGCGWFGIGCSALRCGVTSKVANKDDMEDCAVAKKDAKQSDAPRVSNVQDAQATKERFLDAFVHKVEEKLEEKFKDMVTKAVKDEEEEEDHEDYKEE